MNKCRICLESKRNLCSIYESDEGLSYASMISLVTGIKIVQNSYGMICLICRRKLKDLYEFKQLIERSEVELSKQCKIFKFNTITDIKVEFFQDIDLKNTESVSKGYKNLFQYKNDSFYYNDTQIRKLNEDEKETIPIEEFLNSIKTEEFDDCNNYVDDYSSISINYEENNHKKKKKKNKKLEKHKKSDKSKPQKSSYVRIKPVFLNDIRVLKTSTNIMRRRKTYSKSRKDGICPFCGKITKSMRTHILTHSGERKFKCNECPRSFYTKNLLEYHIKSHFTKKETFKCEHCISTFTSRGAVTRHMAIHMEYKRFTCQICKKGFKWKSGLRRHMLIHDMGAKSIKCDVCQMSFYTQTNLKDHSRVHTGERPYKCELCSQPYSYKRDFNRHCLKKHGVIVDRRPVYVMNEDVLRREKALMKDLMLRLHGMPTETEPMDSFQGPQKALAFAKAVKVMQNGQIPIEIHI